MHYTYDMQFWQICGFFKKEISTPVNKNNTYILYGGLSFYTHSSSTDLLFYLSALSRSLHTSYRGVFAKDIL